MPVLTPHAAPTHAVPPSLSHSKLNKSLSGHGDVDMHTDVHVTELSPSHEGFPENVAKRVVELSNAAHANPHLTQNFLFVSNRLGAKDLQSQGVDARVLLKSGDFLAKVVRASEMRPSELEAYAKQFSDGPELALRSKDQRFVREFIPVALIVTNKATREAFKAFLAAVEAVDVNDRAANVTSPKFQDVITKSAELVKDFEQEVAGLTNKLVISSVTSGLERVAALLQAKGLVKLAGMLDTVANSVEAPYHT